MICRRTPRRRVHCRGWLPAILLAGMAGMAAADTEWPVTGGDPGNRKFSPLVQINRQNVQTLEPAWEYRSAAGAELFSSSEL